MEQEFNYYKLTWWLVFSIVALTAFFGSFYTVQPWQRAFTVQFGSISSNVYSNWLHLKRPVVASVVKFDIQTQKITAKAGASSKDLQIVDSDVAVNYSIDQSQVINLYKTIGNMSTIEDRIINPIIQEAIKASTAKYTAEELISKRDLVSSDILTTLKNKMWDKWINVTAFNILNFKFSAEFNTAIEQKVKAEQEALTQKNVLEQRKYEAQQIVVKAQADAEAIAIQAKAVTSQWGADYVKLQWIKQWDGKLPSTVLGSNMNMFMNLTQ